jgi:5'-3' exonuclease
VTVWAMVDLEADDALAAAARTAAEDPRVEQVVICTPDKDLAQCVTDPRVVQLDRRQRRLFDEAAVREKFGVSPASIPDWLALVGDNADGFPGLPGWGAKSAAAVLARYGHIEEIPVDATTWDVPVRGATKLSATLGDGQKEAMLFRDLATLRADAPVGAVDDWRWRGPRPELERFSERFGAPELLARARKAAEGREP